MEEAFILEIFHKGSTYELPANIRFDSGGYQLYISLPSASAVFEGQQAGDHKVYFLNGKAKRDIDKRDRKLIKLISTHIDAIIV